MEHLNSKRVEVYYVYKGFGWYVKIKYIFNKVKWFNQCCSYELSGISRCSNIEVQRTIK